MTITSDRRSEVGEFFAANAGRLQRTVAAKARVQCWETIEDACATAWAILVRRDDIALDARGFKCLTTVAIRRAWQLAGTTSETPVGSFQSHDAADDDLPDPADTLTLSPEERALDRIQHAADIAAFKRLKPHEREALFLKSLGYSYHEIAALTGASYTAVNRRLTEGRRRMRNLASTRDHRA